MGKDGVEGNGGAPVRIAATLAEIGAASRACGMDAIADFPASSPQDCENVKEP